MPAVKSNPTNARTIFSDRSRIMATSCSMTNRGKDVDLKNLMELFVGPNGQFVAAGIEKVEAASPGEFECRLHYCASCSDDFFLHAMDIGGVDNNQRSSGLDFGRSIKTASYPAVMERGIIRTVILKLPTQEPGIKFFRLAEILYWKFNVVDLQVILG